MAEELWLRWMFLGLIFVNGIVLGLRLFGPKVAKEGRLSGVLMPIAMTLIFGPFVIDSSSALRWGTLSVAVALLLMYGVLRMRANLRPKVAT